MSRRFDRRRDGAINRRSLWQIKTFFWFGGVPTNQTATALQVNLSGKAVLVERCLVQHDPCRQKIGTQIDSAKSASRITPRDVLGTTDQIAVDINQSAD